jgi:hypothetical protein
MILAVTLLCATFSFSQTYQGPVTLSVDSGAVVNIDLLTDSPIFSNEGIINDKNLIYPDIEPFIIENEGSDILQTTYVEDPNLPNNTSGVGDNTFLLEKWDVQQANNVIPPDPTLAVGPNHVIVLTNDGNGIRIYDKQGTLVKLINSTQFWSAIYPSQSGDPQIIYDHYAGRWVMVFMQIDDIALQAGDLVAYSDDDDPFGTWYMYRLPNNLWGDFPQIGFDEEAIYIATNNFTFGGDGQYAKIRIISKAELYSSNAGPLSYTDIWNISIPNSGSPVWNLRPSFQYSPADGHYFLYAGNRQDGAPTNYYSFYKLTNPTTNPVLTGVNIIVPFYYPTPRANQLGGGSPLIESGGSAIRNAPIFRDGFLFATHSIRNSLYPTNSSVKYFKIDVSNNTVVESAELGANGYYYIYPAIAVDKDGNVVINFSRSANTEYMGAYYASRRATDAPGLSGAFELQPGLGNYVKTFNGTRNRWGDYMGAFLDPADEYSFWMFTEYASTGNNYACVVGQVRLEPLAGIYVFPEGQDYDFGKIEVGSSSDTISALLANYGTDDLIISSIPASFQDISLVSSHTFPITLQTYDSLTLKFVYNPSTVAVIDTIYPVINNSTNFTGIRVSATGFLINSVDRDQIYSVSGVQNGGNFSSIDYQTGAGTNIGETGFSNLVGLAIHPKTNIAYALISSASGSQILRVNGTEGDTYPLFDLALSNLYSMTFDSSGQLYANTQAGIIYSIDLSNSTFTQISQMPVQRVSMAFNLVDNQLWGTVRNLVGVKDRIIKISLTSGDTTNVGQTGFGVNNNSIVFDGAGNFYGITGTATVDNNLISIDKTTGIGTLIGSTGLFDLKAIALSPSITVGIDTKETAIPGEYALDQNYPNPFNPSTQIKFALPTNSSVRITIYNLLGEVVRELVNTDMNSGVHTVQWNAEDISGRKVSSGIYFYELNANGINGNQFNQVRKMILMK